MRAGGYVGTVVVVAWLSLASVALRGPYRQLILLIVQKTFLMTIMNLYLEIE
jgi:hypothetical protein